jgi:HSP20 family protein
MTNLVPWKAGRRSVRPFSWDVGDFDRAIEDLWRGFGLESTRPAAFTPRVDVHEDESGYRITAELPGLEEKDFDVHLEGDLLTIKGEKREELKEERKSYRHVETVAGAFERRFHLPTEVEADKISASYKNGVLTVMLPKAEVARPRTIRVTAQ